MFTILGADGKEYGPVGAEELRRWVREGRAGGQTQVRVAGAKNWVPLQSLPELVADFTATALPSQPFLPPVVRTLAVGMFVVEGISLLFTLIGLFGALQYLRQPG